MGTARPGYNGDQSGAGSHIGEGGEGGGGNRSRKNREIRGEAEEEDRMIW